MRVHFNKRKSPHFDCREHDNQSAKFFSHATSNLIFRDPFDWNLHDEQYLKLVKNITSSFVLSDPECPLDSHTLPTERSATDIFHGQQDQGQGLSSSIL
jgi:hypothetical protein